MKKKLKPNVNKNMSHLCLHNKEFLALYFTCNLKADIKTFAGHKILNTLVEQCKHEKR